MMDRWLLTLLLVFAPLVSSIAASPDLPLADFEGGTYGAWQASGEAFGRAPATGPFPKQRKIKGVQGQAFVNSRFIGDKTTGTLTSPPFTIERNYLCFLIGGGRHLGTSLNLRVDGHTVRFASGDNDEALLPLCWDVKALRGRTAVLQIIDTELATWGHVNVDNIVQSDAPQGPILELTSNTLIVQRPYLNVRLPQAAHPAAGVWLKPVGSTVWEIPDVPLRSPQWLSWDLAHQQGKNLEFIVSESMSRESPLRIRDSLAQSDQPRGPVLVFDKPYAETWRPQFHFTAPAHWLNDPNGLVYYDGEYHMFYQCNPFGRTSANKAWGHAVSPDLFHWQPLGIPLLPDERGMIFSGSAVVDERNSAGLQQGREKTLVAFYTNAPTTGTTRTQSLAYSTDRGRTWTKYAGNPVVPNIIGRNRDPKVFWHAPSHKWIMALFLNANQYALLNSDDLKHWNRLSTVKVPGVSECPDMFELAVEGAPAQKHWVFWGGSGDYLLGQFDGTTFTPETQPIRSEYGANCYAAQTWNNIPASDGRRIFLVWMRGGNYPSMPFNQQMTVPRTMVLRQTPAGLRLCMLPVREIETLRTATQSWSDLHLKPGQNPLAKLSGDLFDFELGVRPAANGTLEINLRGEPLVYDAAKQQLTLLGKSMPAALQNGLLTLRVLVDRTSIEVFTNGGEYVMSCCFLPAPWQTGYALTTTGGAAHILDLKAHTLKSAWPAQP